MTSCAWKTTIKDSERRTLTGHLSPPGTTATRSSSPAVENRTAVPTCRYRALNCAGAEPASDNQYWVSQARCPYRARPIKLPAQTRARSYGRLRSGDKGRPHFAAYPCRSCHPPVSLQLRQRLLLRSALLRWARQIDRSPL